jgi:hypothetical protein
MSCGIVLREALKHEDIAVVVLYDQSTDDSESFSMADVDEDVQQSGEGIFWKFFSWIDKGAFEVSTDAFTTFRVGILCRDAMHSSQDAQDVLTRHKSLVAHYLGVNFDLFFSMYNNILINSSSYVTKRQSIKLLGEILLDRANYNIMTAYVDSGDHLKLCMNLLKDDRKMVQYEGFHVFKVSRSPFGSSTLPTCAGVRRESKQIHCCAEDSHQQPREASEVSPGLSRRADRRRSVYGREELLSSANRDHACGTRGANERIARGDMHPSWTRFSSITTVFARLIGESLGMKSWLDSGYVAMRCTDIFVESVNCPRASCSERQGYFRKLRCFGSAKLRGRDSGRRADHVTPEAHDISLWYFNHDTA